MGIITFYKIPAPYAMGETMIEVYGGENEGWSEWRINEGGKVKQDTGTEGNGSLRGRQYGSPEIALRDALMVATGLDDPHAEEMRRIEGKGLES